MGRFSARIYGRHLARRAAWRQAVGDPETFREIMRAHLAVAGRVTVVSLIAAAFIILSDIWPVIPL
ncbi:MULTISPECIES: hypothetical protein [Thermomonosporaceae]|uniref:hypothetical protein n=1 Tax=Thermomonosporaceae TaxID=2012 RepID=UPI00255AE442|nr:MULTISPECIES: hypothetical protein [Thermomonosporaceae]MDL4777198.1 hypothetical protein [Actinomadura xylanilytica]